MIKTCLTNEGRLAFLKGMVKSTHKFKIALYTNKAKLDKSTQRYTSDGEVIGAGYASKLLAEPVYGVKDDVAYMDFPGDIVWQNATIKAHGCMIYDTNLDNLAILIVAFDAETSSTNAEFRLSPATDIIRLE